VKWSQVSPSGSWMNGKTSVTGVGAAVSVVSRASVVTVTGSLTEVLPPKSRAVTRKVWVDSGSRSPNVAVDSRLPLTSVAPSIATDHQTGPSSTVEKASDTLVGPTFVTVTTGLVGGTRSRGVVPVTTLLIFEPFPAVSRATTKSENELPDSTPFV
jgi:hypothetical protein